MSVPITVGPVSTEEYNPDMDHSGSSQISDCCSSCSFHVPRALSEILRDIPTIKQLEREETFDSSRVHLEYKLSWWCITLS